MSIIPDRQLPPVTLGETRVAAWTGPRIGDTGTITRRNGIARSIIRWDSDGAETDYAMSAVHRPDWLTAYGSVPPAYGGHVRASRFTRGSTADGTHAGMELTFTGIVKGSPRNNPVEWVAIEPDRDLVDAELDILARAGGRRLLSAVIIPAQTLAAWTFEPLSPAQALAVATLAAEHDTWVAMGDLPEDMAGAFLRGLRGEAELS